MSDYLLDGATREIERLNKIARQFEDEVARLTRENDDLREALTDLLDIIAPDRRHPQFKIKDLEPYFQEVFRKALATLDVEEKM